MFVKKDFLSKFSESLYLLIIIYIITPFKIAINSKLVLMSIFSTCHSFSRFYMSIENNTIINICFAEPIILTSPVKVCGLNPIPLLKRNYFDCLH